MTMKLATDAMESKPRRADALGVAADCADAVVGIGAALRRCRLREPSHPQLLTVAHRVVPKGVGIWCPFSPIVFDDSVVTPVPCVKIGVGHPPTSRLLGASSPSNSLTLGA